MNRKCLFILLCLTLMASGPAYAQPAQDHNDHDDDHAEHVGHDEHGHEESTVHVSRDMQKAIGLTFEKAQMRPCEETIVVYGRIAQDTDKYTHVSSNGEGTVEKIYIQTGSIIDTGEPVLSIAKDGGTIEMIAAPHHGTVIAVHARPGEKVDHLRSLVSLSDLDRLRVSFDVYEKDLRFVSTGQEVNVYSTAYPGRVFRGEVVFVSPRIDKHTQTIKIRAEVNNHDHLLRLGMFVTGDLIYSTGGNVLSVSQRAVQQIEEESVVFLPEGDQFSTRDIQTGREFGDYVEVLSGLKEGQQVVSAGSFALKSELQKGAFGHGHAH